MRVDRTDRWRPSGALQAALLAVLVCLVVAVLGRRPDLVVVAAPIVVGSALALSRPLGPRSEAVTLRVPDRPVWEGDLVMTEVRVEVTGGAEFACIGVQHGSDVRIEWPGPLQVVPLRPGVNTFRLPCRANHWGRSQYGPVEVTFVGAHGLFHRDRPAGRTESLVIVPLRAVFDATDQMPDPAGLVGTHRSRRAGGGTDLLGIRPFQVGDRMRRITWPVSLRTGQLHVTTTTDDRDTDVMLLLDSQVEVGDRRSATGTSLDVAVRATASVAEHYLRQGDRVGVLDLARPRRPVRLDAGRRHMLRVLDLLVDAAPNEAYFGAAPDVGTHLGRALRDVPPRALVMVFGALLDTGSAQRIARLARGGHTVLVVDTLPENATPQLAEEWTPLAWQIALLGRENLRQRLAELGVPVVAWRGAGSLDQVLRVLSRAAVVPRQARR